MATQLYHRIRFHWQLLLLLALLGVLLVSQHVIIEIGAALGVLLLIYVTWPTRQTQPIPPPYTATTLIQHGLADIMDNIADYVAIVNQSGQLVYINPAGRALVGAIDSPDQVPASFFLPQWALNSLGQPPAMAFKNGLWKADSVIHLMENVTIPVYQVVIAHLDEAGRVNQISTICRDRLEQQFAEESSLRLMVQAEKLKALQEMIAHFSHDLKSPLTAIVTSLYLAERQTQDADRRQARFDTIREQTRLLEKMIQDVLTYSRFEVVPTLNHQAVNLVALLNQIKQNLLPQIEDKALSVELDMPPTGCFMSGDLDGLTHMFSNLIENAVKYTPSQGQVTVRLQSVDHTATVTIQDSGIGIDPNEIPRIFEQFFRASSAKESNIDGTGVGLAIVKRVIDLHAGTINVTSALGQGTTFIVQLPLAPPNGAA